jgi:sulfate transport system permease protein
LPLLEQGSDLRLQAGLQRRWRQRRLLLLVMLMMWGLLYGVILCNARAMGEFGAVSVVSGHIRGQTNTMPLHVEILYNEYQSVAAFAVASLLALLALITLVIKTFIEWQQQKLMAELAALSPERPVN